MKTIKSIEQFKKIYLPNKQREDFENRVGEYPEILGKYLASRYMVKMRKKKKVKVCDDCGLPLDLCVCEELRKEEERTRQWWVSK